MFTLLIIGIATLGLVVGSFLNVAICRVPRHQSVVTPRSACPSCGTAIAAKDNVPVLSWLLLKGHCRTCETRISFRYPLVELGTSALFVGAAARFGFDWVLPAYLVLLAGLLVLAWIDVEHMVLPKAIVYPLLGIVTGLLLVAAIWTHQWHHFLVALVCAAVWFAFFFTLNAINPRWLGFGDVRLAPVLGLGLGWLGVPYVLMGFFSANLIGAVVGISLIAAKRMSRNQQIPFGVFLALGTALAIFAGSQLLALFRHIY